MLIRRHSILRLAGRAYELLTDLSLASSPFVNYSYVSAVLSLELVSWTNVLPVRDSTTHTMAGSGSERRDGCVWRCGNKSGWLVSQTAQVNRHGNKTGLAWGCLAERPVSPDSTIPPANDEYTEPARTTRCCARRAAMGTRYRTSCSPPMPMLTCPSCHYRW